MGYKEGKNIRLDWRNLPNEAAAHKTAKAFVQSLSHPGGNLTGFATHVFGLPDKKLDLFKQLVPHLRRVLVLRDPNDPLTPSMLTELRKAAAALQLQLVEHPVTDQAGIERVFGSLQPGDVDGVYVLSPNLQVKFSSLLIRLTAERGLPLPGYRKEWVGRGALFSYASNIRAIGRDAATYVDKILKSTKPGGLPVQRSMRLELVINLKTAKKIGLTPLLSSTTCTAPD